MWSSAVYQPCVNLRAKNGIKPAAPPITWTWSPLDPLDPRAGHSGIIKRYGVRSHVPVFKATLLTNCSLILPLLRSVLVGLSVANLPSTRN